MSRGYNSYLDGVHTYDWYMENYLYERLGGRLTTRHLQGVLNVERKLCRCRKTMEGGTMRGSYPPCVYKAYGDVLPTSDKLVLVDNFWKGLIKELQKKHADWVMEVYLDG